MSELTTGPIADPDILTFSQIKRRYPGGWVLVEDPTKHEGECLFGGRVVFFGKDRASVHQATMNSEAADIGVLFTGKRVGPFSLNLT